MADPRSPDCNWTARTIERMNARLGVQPDDDVGIEDWPAAMSDPALVGAALDAYDSDATGHDGRALLVEWLLNTFEFCSIEREGNSDWRRTLDRIERDFDEHAATVRRWAEPDDGIPWLVSEAMTAVLARRVARQRGA